MQDFRLDPCESTICVTSLRVIEQVSPICSVTRRRQPASVEHVGTLCALMSLRGACAFAPLCGVKLTPDAAQAVSWLGGHFSYESAADCYLGSCALCPMGCANFLLRRPEHPVFCLTTPDILMIEAI